MPRRSALRSCDAGFDAFRCELLALTPRCHRPTWSLHRPRSTATESAQRARDEEAHGGRGGWVAQHATRRYNLRWALCLAGALLARSPLNAVLAVLGASVCAVAIAPTIALRAHGRQGYGVRVGRQPARTARRHGRRLERRADTARRQQQAQSRLRGERRQNRADRMRAVPLGGAQRYVHPTAVPKVARVAYSVRFASGAAATAQRPTACFIQLASNTASHAIQMRRVLRLRATVVIGAGRPLLQSAIRC